MQILYARYIFLVYSQQRTPVFIHLKMDRKYVGYKFLKTIVLYLKRIKMSTINVHSSKNIVQHQKYIASTLVDNELLVILQRFKIGGIRYEKFGFKYG